MTLWNVRCLSLYLVSTETNFEMRLPNRAFPLNCYAKCSFDMSLLPQKLNLPMLCEPVQWHSTKPKPSTLSDLSGGYLSSPSADFYNSFRLLTTRDSNHFNIKSPEDCTVLGLEWASGSSEINKQVLGFGTAQREGLVECHNNGITPPDRALPPQLLV